LVLDQERAFSDYALGLVLDALPQSSVRELAGVGLLVTSKGPLLQDHLAARISRDHLPHLNFDRVLVDYDLHHMSDLALAEFKDLCVVFKSIQNCQKKLE